MAEKSERKGAKKVKEGSEESEGRRRRRESARG